MREKQREKVRTVQAAGNLRTTRQIICTIRTIQHYNCMIPGSISQAGQSKFEQQKQEQQQQQQKRKKEKSRKYVCAGYMVQAKKDFIVCRKKLQRDIQAKDILVLNTPILGLETCVLFLELRQRDW